MTLSRIWYPPPGAAVNGQQCTVSGRFTWSTGLLLLGKIVTKLAPSMSGTSLSVVLGQLIFGGSGKEQYKYTYMSFPYPNRLLFIVKRKMRNITLMPHWTDAGICFKEDIIIIIVMITGIISEYLVFMGYNPKSLNKRQLEIFHFICNDNDVMIRRYERLH